MLWYNFCSRSSTRGSWSLGKPHPCLVFSLTRLLSCLSSREHSPKNNLNKKSHTRCCFQGIQSEFIWHMVLENSIRDGILAGSPGCRIERRTTSLVGDKAQLVPDLLIAKTFTHEELGRDTSGKSYMNWCNEIGVWKV